MKRVLIVASDAAAARLQRTILWRSEIERVILPSPEQGLHATRDFKPQLVVLDGQTSRSIFFESGTVIGAQSSS